MGDLRVQRVFGSERRFAAFVPCAFCGHGAPIRELHILSGRSFALVECLFWVCLPACTRVVPELHVNAACSGDGWGGTIPVIKKSRGEIATG
jgi:hypothetical protein